MSTKSSAFVARIAQLRAAFIAYIPSQLAEARDLLMLMQADDERQKDAAIQLKRVFHNLKGSSASFGLKSLSAGAETAELLMEHVTSQPHLVTTEFAGEISQQISAIDWLSIQATNDLLAQDRAYADANPQSASCDQDQAQTEAVSVYVCDDDPFQTEQIQSQLRCFGYDVKVFSTVDDLRNAVQNQRPDAIVMDVVFPEGEDAGLVAIRELQLLTEQKLPTIFISGRSDFSTRLEAVKAGGMAFLTKPLHCLEIVEYLDVLTSRAVPEPYRVLVIDDEPQIAALHAAILEEAGMVTHVIHEPAAALEALRTYRPELVLMDMYMPGCTGAELAQVIRQMSEYIDMPIVYLSSETDVGKQQMALSVGADDFLIKPIEPGSLVSSVVVRAERMRSLRTLMVRDSLTGLFNHTATKQFLENAVTNARRRQGVVSFAMIDVDHFKSVNDTYGHPVGDQVLLALARLLRQQLRQNDLVGRYGGEEFAVVLLDATVDKAKNIIDNLRADFASIKFWANDVEFSVTFSAGVAEFPGCDGTDELCELADHALYQAKHTGRNRVVTADADREVR